MGHFCAGFLNVMLSGGREHGLRVPASGGALGEGSGSVLCPDPLLGSSCAPLQVLSSRVSAGPWSLTTGSFLPCRLYHDRQVQRYKYTTFCPNDQSNCEVLPTLTAEFSWDAAHWGPCAIFHPCSSLITSLPHFSGLYCFLLGILPNFSLS